MKVLNDSNPSFNAHGWVIFNILETKCTVCYVPHSNYIFNIEAEKRNSSTAYWYLKDLVNTYENSK